MKAVVSVTFDDAFAVHDIKVIEGQDKLFVAMPSRKNSPDGEFKDIAHPINAETREIIQKAIIEKIQRSGGRRCRITPADYARRRTLTQKAVSISLPLFYNFRKLKCSEKSVACIAQARYDVAVFVKLFRRVRPRKYQRRGGAF